MIWQRIWSWLKWPIGLAVIGSLMWMNREGLAKVYSNEKNYWLLVAAVFFQAAATLITFGRWYLLVAAQGFPFKLSDAVRLGFVGLVTSLVAPFAIGGDLVKAMLLIRDQKSRRTTAVATILLDRILGLIGLFIIGLAGILVCRGQLPAAIERTAATLFWTGTGLGLGSVGVMLIPGSSQWGIVRWTTRLPIAGPRIAEVLQGIALYQSRPMAIVGAVLLSLVSHICLIMSLYCGAGVLQSWSPSAISHFSFVPTAELLASMLPTPGGLGGLEGAIPYCYSLFAGERISEADAKAAGLNAALMFRVAGLTVTVFGTGYYLAARKDVADALQEGNHAADVKSEAKPDAPETPTEVVAT